MKKTQMIHSPRTFKIGLGLILAASLASMPVLTGASERRDAKAAAASKKLSQSGKAANHEQTSSKQMEKKPEEQPDSSNERTGKGKRSISEDRSRERATERTKVRMAKLEDEARKLTSKLTSSQKTNLLSLLNDAKPEALMGIQGVGKSRSTAIEQARPIKSIEDLPKLKGVGLKTLAEVVDHGKGLTQKQNVPNPKQGKKELPAR